MTDPYGGVILYPPPPGAIWGPDPHPRQLPFGSVQRHESLRVLIETRFEYAKLVYWDGEGAYIRRMLEDRCRSHVSEIEHNINTKYKETHQTLNVINRPR